MTRPRYSIVIPTFRRPDHLGECLECLCGLDYPMEAVDVLVIDNGGADHSIVISTPFLTRLRIRHLVNATNRGYGFSVNRGIAENTGDRVMLLNDDARPSAGLLRECDRLLAADSAIGCVGCRPIEAGYVESGDGIGQISTTGEVIGNFVRDCGEPIEVEHVYGFCYVFTREAIDRAGLNDLTLLARPYSTGDRIETDHCLSIRRRGLKVVFNPRMVVQHLAQPRPDISEASLRWKLNGTRNTIYLYLKHYGLFGKGAAALRLTFIKDVGLLSALRRPSRANAAYFLNGLRARASAYLHYIGYLLGPGFDSPESFRKRLEAETRG